MEELRIPFDMLIHPDMEALQKRDEFMSAMEKNVKIEKMDSDGIIADIVVKEWLNEGVVMNKRFFKFAREAAK